MKALLAKNNVQDAIANLFIQEDAMSVQHEWVMLYILVVRTKL